MELFPVVFLGLILVDLFPAELFLGDLQVPFQIFHRFHRKLILVVWLLEAVLVEIYLQAANLLTRLEKHEYTPVAGQFGTEERIYKAPYREDIAQIAEKKLRDAGMRILKGSGVEGVPANLEKAVKARLDAIK